MEEGKRYYIIAHAYYHFVGEVVKVIGPKSVELRNVCQVHSCGRNWSEFFAGGFGRDTKYDVWPDGLVVSAITYVPWDHEIPLHREIPTSRK